MTAIRAVLIGVFLLFVSVAFAADLNKGIQAFHLGDYAAAQAEFRPLAVQGNAQAQFNLGVIYDKGLGVQQDDAEAAQWFRESAGQGDANAQYALGVLYADGRGVAQDDAAAVQWYRKAAAQGSALAQNNLGTIYEFGKGVTQDYAKAYALFNLSASIDATDDNKATAARVHVMRLMTPAQITAGQALTLEMQKVGVLQALDAQ
ncbi:MAG: tetratricopeptide repeat protein [Stenotrophobium sp.]